MQGKRHPEYQYLDLLSDIMRNGVEKTDHNTGNSLRSVFGRQIRFDLSEGLPLLTTKKVFWKGVAHELIWFMTGQTNIKYLVDNDVHIWDDYPYKLYGKATESDSSLERLTQEQFIERIRDDSTFAEKWGELPHIYGEQWRKWQADGGREVDQLKWALESTRDFPDRKHQVMSAWNSGQLYQMAPPGEALSFPLCHIMTHFNVSDGKLSAQLYQRSCDAFLGVPFNIASYALLTQAAAQLTGFEPGDFVHTYGDIHVYGDHFAQVEEQLSREPRPFPTVKINPELKSVDDLDRITYDDFTLENYDPHPPIRAPLTVAGGFDEKDRK
ncbi:thymidylate synthase [Candidatus Pacearchaeota archaeon]|nr:thymidylate synthase [Candidatus Pacearchaeota archaeon]